MTKNQQGLPSGFDLRTSEALGAFHEIIVQTNCAAATMEATAATSIGALSTAPHREVFKNLPR